jgi:hypothetical protein
MSRAGLVARAQAFAEAGMADTCTIRRPTGVTSDEFSGTTVTTYASPDPYAGVCRFKQGEALGREENVGEDLIILLRQILQLPARVTGLQVGDEVTCVTSQDPDLPGRTFVIRDLMHQTDASARRVQIVERTG